MGYKGHLDICDHGLLHGWAFDPLYPQKPVTVDIYINDMFAESVIADRLRPDVATTFGKELTCGFTVNIRAHLANGYNLITAKSQQDGILFDNYLLIQHNNADNKLYHGSVDGAWKNKIHGWCININNPDSHTVVELHCDDTCIATTEVGQERLDISELFDTGTGTGFIFDLDGIDFSNVKHIAIKPQGTSIELECSTEILSQINLPQTPIENKKNHAKKSHVNLSTSLIPNYDFSISDIAYMVKKSSNEITSGYPYSEQLVAENIKIIGEAFPDYAAQLAKSVGPTARKKHTLRVCSQILRRTGQLTLSNTYLDKAQSTTPFTETFSEKNARTLQNIKVEVIDDILKKSTYCYTPVRSKSIHDKRVIYYVHHSEPYHQNGYTSRTMEIIKSLRKHIDIHIVSRLGFPETTHNLESINEISPFHLLQGVPIHIRHHKKHNIKKILLGKYIQQASEDLKNFSLIHGANCIHATSNYISGIIAWRSAHMLGLPFFYEMRGLWHETKGSRLPSFFESDEFNLQRDMEIQTAKLATHVFCLNSSIANYIIEGGVSPKRISLVQNAIDPARFNDIAYKRRVSPSGQIRFGYIGSIVDYEGLELMINAIAKLPPPLIKKVSFDIIGSGHDEKKLHALTTKLELDSIITWHGQVDRNKVLDYYKNIDIFCIPRLNWRVTQLVTSLKQFEAMAAGCAIFASDVKPIADIVQDGSHGWLFSAGSIDSATTRLYEILTTCEVDEIRSKGLRAQKFVNEFHSWENQISPILKQYQHI